MFGLVLVTYGQLEASSRTGHHPRLLRSATHGGAPLSDPVQLAVQQGCPGTFSSRGVDTAFGAAGGGPGCIFVLGKQTPPRGIYCLLSESFLGFSLTFCHIHTLLYKG